MLGQQGGDNLYCLIIMTMIIMIIIIIIITIQYQKPREDFAPFGLSQRKVNLCCCNNDNNNSSYYYYYNDNNNSNNNNSISNNDRSSLRRELWHRWEFLAGKADGANHYTTRAPWLIAASRHHPSSAVLLGPSCVCWGNKGEITYTV